MKRKSQRGFTLVELIIAMVIGTVVLAGAGSVLIAQKNGNKKTTEMVTINQSMRRSLTYMREKIAMAGFGIPRVYATSNCDDDNYLNSNTCTFVKDSANAYVGDRIHVRYRNPIGEWSATYSSNNLNLIAIDNRTDFLFSKGQTLMMVGNANRTALSYATAAKDAAGNKTVSIGYDNRTPFYGNSHSTASIPYINGRWRIAMVDSYMFRVVPMVTADGEYVNQLVADLRKDINGDGNINDDDYLPLASNVYDMQIQYYADLNGDGKLSGGELTPFTASTNKTVGTQSLKLNDPVGNGAAILGAQLKAVAITLRFYKTDNKKVAPNTLDQSDDSQIRIYSLSEYIPLKNIDTGKGIITNKNDVNGFYWMGSSYMRDNARK